MRPSIRLTLSFDGATVDAAVERALKKHRKTLELDAPR